MPIALTATAAQNLSPSSLLFHRFNLSEVPNRSERSVNRERTPFAACHSYRKPIESRGRRTFAQAGCRLEVPARPMALIPRTDLDVFGLNLGCNVFGWTASREESFAVLDAYAAAGGNFLDTADVYMAAAPGNKAASRRRSSANGWPPAAAATAS